MKRKSQKLPILNLKPKSISLQESLEFQPLEVMKRMEKKEKLHLLNYRMIQDKSLIHYGIKMLN